MPAKGVHVWKRRWRYGNGLIVATLFAVVIGACGTDDRGSGDEASPVTVVVLTHDSFAMSESLLEEFADRTGITIEIRPAGDAGEVLNQSILSAGNPLGDVMFGVDNTFLGRALEADIFEAYRSPLLANIPAELQLDADSRLLPVDVGDVCVNFDRSAYGEGEAPSGFDDLIDPRFAGQLVVQNPATSSPGLAFLLATVAAFGDEGATTWRDYWAALVANDVAVQTGWSEAYYGDFTVGGGGERPMVVSYGSSPPAEVIFADPPVSEAPTAVVEATCFRQIEFVGILSGTSHPEAARQVIDFFLSVEVQEDIPLNMFVYPAHAEAAVPSEFVEHTVVPSKPWTLDPEVIEANRDRWIEQWVEIVLG